MLDGLQPKDVLARLDTVLEKRGHQKLRTSIYAQLRKYEALRESSETPVVTVAKEGDFKRLKTAISAALDTTGAGEGHTKDVVDERLTGGFIVRHKNTEVDASYRTKLLSLYQKSISY